MQHRPFEIPLVKREIASQLNYMIDCCVCFCVQYMSLEE